MALNFGILQPVNIGGQFMAGQQQAQENQLAQQQAAMRQQEMGMRQQEMEMRQREATEKTEDRATKLAKAETRTKFLTDLSAKMKEGGHKLDRETLSSMMNFGLQSNETSLVNLATEGLKALDEDERFKTEMGSFAPKPSTAPVATAAPGALGSGTFDPSAPAPVAPVNALAPAVAAPAAAPVNALAAAPTAAPAMAGGYTRSQIERMLLSPTDRVRKTGVALLAALPKAAAPAAPTTLSKLQNELAALPPGDPRRAEYVALIRKETTHAPATTVNVSTEKAYGGAFGGKMAENDINKLTTAERAPQLAESANRIIGIVQEGNVFTGPAADIKLNIARALNVTGANNQEKIANTESLIAASGQSTLDAIKSAGLGTGQGFTDKDLKFLQNIAGGTVNLTPQTLKELATLQHRAATRSVESWNKRVGEMPPSVIQGTGLSTVPIKVPPLAGGRSAGPAIGTVQEGYRFKGGNPAISANWEKQ